MIGTLIVFFVLCWVLTGGMRLEKKKERILRNNKEETTVTLIQFDRWTVRLLGILTAVSVIATIVSIVIAEYVEPAAGVFVFAGGCLVIIFAGSWWRGICYLKRLKKYGYKIPEKGKDYDYLLEHLPRTEVTIVQELYNRRSKVLARVCLCIMMGMLAVNVWYYCSWSFLTDAVGSVLVMLVVADMFWLFASLQFRKQMSNKAYKEDVEIDKTGKNRMSPEHAVLLLVGMLIATGFVKSMAFSMSKYVYNARVDADRQVVRQIQETLAQVYEELVVQKNLELADDELNVPYEISANWESSRQQLIEGVDITDWCVPQDIFQAKVAEYIGVTDFAELKNDFRTAKGDAILFAQVEDEQMTLSLTNLQKEVSSPIIIKSE